MTVICDIDGTLLINGVQPNAATIERLKSIGDSHIVIITGRMENQRRSTVQALKAAGVSYSSLLMNTLGPGKTEQQQSKLANAKKVMPVDLAIDNDSKMRSMYESIGVKRVVGP